MRVTFTTRDTDRLGEDPLNTMAGTGSVSLGLLWFLGIGLLWSVPQRFTISAASLFHRPLCPVKAE